jgi:hypothetical protein
MKCGAWEDAQRLFHTVASESVDNNLFLDDHKTSTRFTIAWII